MVTPTNPKILVFNRDGLPAPKAKVFFFEHGTDVPKSVKYVSSGTSTGEITADDSGKFPEVELLVGEYTLKSFIPLDPKEAYPIFPDDYELLDTWDLSGAPDPANNDNDAVVSLADIAALRAYDGDETKVWIRDRLFIKEPLLYADNNGTIIVSSALDNVEWRMDLTGYNMTSVEWFGVDRTGTNDSTAAILGAISAIYANDGLAARFKLPRKLYIPDGTYVINSDITFSCPVYMEPKARFANTNVSAVNITFQSTLETVKTNAMMSELPGYSGINLKFPNGGKVNLAWYGSSKTITMSDHPSKIDIVGPGTIVVDANRSIGSLTTNGIVEFQTNSGCTLSIDEIVSGPGNLNVTGSGALKVSTLNLSWLYSEIMLTKVSGDVLVIDENWDIPSGFNSNWSRVEGKLVNGAKPVLKNTSGTVGYVGFPNADVDWESLDCSAHDLVWTNGPVAKYLNWSGTDGSDWTAQLAYSLADFTGTSTSGDIILTASATLKNLNHTGTMMAFGYSLILDSCTINLTTGKQVRASALTISDSSILNDSPSNGQIVSSNMRLRNSYITCSVYLYGADNMQLEMRGCRFTNQVSVSSAYTLQTLVATHNEVAKADFIPYHFTVINFPSDVGVSIDISDNWTTDLSGQLIRTKGIAVLPGSGAGPSTFEAYGFLDMLRPDGYSWAINDIGLTPSPFGSYRKYIVGAVMPLVRAPNGSAQIENPAQTEQQVYCNFWTTQNWRPV